MQAKQSYKLLKFNDIMHMQKKALSKFILITIDKYLQKKEEKLPKNLATKTSLLTIKKFDF